MAKQLPFIPASRTWLKKKTTTEVEYYFKHNNMLFKAPLSVAITRQGPLKASVARTLEIKYISSAINHT